MKFLFLTLLISGPWLNAQQAWTQEKGEAYFQFGSSVLSYSSLHNYTSDPIDIPRPISELILSSYVEYGLTDKLTASVTIPYHIVSSGDIASEWNSFSPKKGDLAALGNIKFDLTYKMYQKNDIALSSKIGLSAPSGKIEQSTGLRTGYNAYAVCPSLLAGIGTSKYFASAEAGMNLMSNRYFNRFVINAQIGKHFLKDQKLLLILGLSTSSALGNSSPDDILTLDGNARLTGLYVNEQSHFAANLKLAYILAQDWTIWSSIAGGVAKNIGRNAVYSLSLSYKLKKKATVNQQ